METKNTLQPPELFDVVFNFNNQTIATNWSAVESAACYKLSLYNVCNFVEKNEFSTIFVQGLSFTFKNKFEFQSQYELTIQSVDEDYYTGPSKTFKLFTPPKPPFNVEFNYVFGTKNIILTWHNHPNTFYNQVKWTLKSQFNQAYHESELFDNNKVRFELEPLSPGEQYEVQVLAFNEFKSSSSFSSITINTRLPTPQNLSVSYNKEEQNLILNWSPIFFFDKQVQYNISIVGDKKNYSQLVYGNILSLPSYVGQPGRKISIYCGARHFDTKEILYSLPASIEVTLPPHKLLELRLKFIEEIHMIQINCPISKEHLVQAYVIK